MIRLGHIEYSNCFPLHAELLERGDANVQIVHGVPSELNRALGRLLKMTKRAIGEMYLGWHRSTDPNDVMFAPLMSLDDLDRMGSEHTEGGKEKPEAPVPKTPSNSA